MIEDFSKGGINREAVLVFTDQGILRLAYGVVKTEYRFCSKVWWPGMDKDVKQIIKQSLSWLSVDSAIFYASVV